MLPEHNSLLLDGMWL